MKLVKKIFGYPYRLIVRVAKKITNFNNVFERNIQLESESEEIREKIKKLEKDYNWGHPKGHFYSPVHSPEDLTEYDDVKQRSTKNFTKEIPGFSDKKMISLYKHLTRYFKDYDYLESDNSSSRFFIKNVSYPITDSLILFAMIRHFKPKRIIEIGSGMTSALMIDVNERFFNNSIDLTFIEPYTDFLYSRIKERDMKKYKIIEKKVQAVPLKLFSELKKGDFLFIDSTHVSKFNSDVNYEIYDILPLLEKGVIVHFHDTFDGFEYPLAWLSQGCAWNEDYILRAFLMNNNQYEVLLMSDYLTARHKDFLLKSFPRVPNNNGGSLWIKKL